MNESECRRWKKLPIEKSAGKSYSEVTTLFMFPQIFRLIDRLKHRIPYDYIL